MPPSLLGGSSLVGNVRRARWLLKRFYNLTPEVGRIIAQTRDPCQTEIPEHLAYHERNRRRGKMTGEARIRVRYKRYVTPWIDFLMVSQDEMEMILEGTKWRVKEYIEGQSGIHIAVLARKRS